MAFPNVSDIVATTIEARSKKIADNVTKNNALLAMLKKKGKIRTVSGGRLIYEELSFAENGNVGWYSGYDTLPVAAQDVLSAAEFSFKQLAVPVTISGLEQLQNSGKEALIDLLEQRIAVAEATMDNHVAEGLYSDGTGTGGKQLTGVDAAVPTSPTTGTYGGIDRALHSFWRSKYSAPGTLTKSNIRPALNSMYASLVRGADRPDLIVMGGTIWATYADTLQENQRFTEAGIADLGFPTVKFMGVDVVLDGGIGGFAGADTAYFFNTKYLHFRPHKDRNMVAIGGKRVATNQDAEVQILGWAGNLTCSGAQFQGRLNGA